MSCTTKSKIHYADHAGVGGGGGMACACQTRGVNDAVSGPEGQRAMRVHERDSGDLWTLNFQFNDVSSPISVVKQVQGVL